MIPVAKRIQILQEGAMPAALEAAATPDLDDSLEDDLGPNFDAMDALPHVAAPESDCSEASHTRYRLVFATLERICNV